MSLFGSVQKNGFALVRIPPSSAKQLDSSLQMFRMNETFRFPPPEGNPFTAWPDMHRESYRCLIDVAKDCFKTLLLEHKESSNAEKKSRERADRILNLHKDLDYSQSSFMNLFNYNYGLLAPHRDRCLVTVVYTHTNPSVNTEPLVSDEVKNLWCLKPGETESEIKSWQSIDSLVVSPERQHSVCLHVGEELSALCEHRLPAALHCVQVDPTRVETPTSHKTPNASNRLSAALILSSDDISAIVEDELL